VKKFPQKKLFFAPQFPYGGSMSVHPLFTSRVAVRSILGEDPRTFTTLGTLARSVAATLRGKTFLEYCSLFVAAGCAPNILAAIFYVCFHPSLWRTADSGRRWAANGISPLSNNLAALSFYKLEETAPKPIQKKLAQPESVQGELTQEQQAIQEPELTEWDESIEPATLLLSKINSLKSIFELLLVRFEIEKNDSFNIPLIDNFISALCDGNPPLIPPLSLNSLTILNAVAESLDSDGNSVHYVRTKEFKGKENLTNVKLSRGFFLMLNEALKISISYAEKRDVTLEVECIFKITSVIKAFIGEVNQDSC
jgi:hypothetical protein